ncbi:sporulation protein [Actinacidiphila sp. bgisy144]|uniref:sporulation protein n=1 Tax=Actinacidiphila sp. bgisy144 TaxID=3413791 RepID=UPI003EC046C6
MLMAEAGASNKGLARRVRDVAMRHGARVGTTHVSVQRWLDGAGIQADNAAYVAEALGAKLGRRITASDLGFVGLTIRPAPVGISYAVSLTDALGVLDGLTQLRPEDSSPAEELPHDNEVDSAVLSWMVSRPDGLPTGREGPRRIGMRDVAAVRTANAMFMRLDFLFGGGHGHAALRHYFRQEVLPLLNGGYSEKVGRSLFAAAAEMGEVLAWTAYDVGNHQLANRYLLASLRLTQVIDDRMMGATILANMSHQANYLGRIPRAARLARAAVEGGRYRATPRARAMFAAHEARALSNSQDSVGASRAMNEAEHHFEQADSATDPEWLAYFGEAELIGEFSHCFRDLERPADSMRFAQLAVEKTAPQYARTLAFCRMVLAQSQYLNGDMDAAVATATTAVREGESLRSARFRHYVTAFQRRISPHASHAVVRDFNEHVRVALADSEDE